MTATGRVAIVGAGPGDPGLLTLAAAKALAECDSVVYDALVAPEILAHVRTGAELIYAGKRSGQHALTQTQMNALLVERAQAGEAVVRLKGGDPFVFGRGSEEAAACRAAGIPYAVVPGIPSAIAAAAYAGIPVTHRGVSDNFLVLTGHNSEGEHGTDWAFAAKAGTLVILMGVERLGAIVAGLMGAGKPDDTPVAAIRWGTRNDQQVVRATLATFETTAKDAALASPAIIVIGGVAAMADDLAWFEPGPLAGRRIVVARARAQASDLAARLRTLGGHVSELPAIESTSHAASPEMQEAATSRPDWLVFPAAAAVDAVFEAISLAENDVRVLGSTRIAAFGAATLARLAEKGLRPDFVPSRATLAALADELPIDANARVFIPASNAATTEAADTLAVRGASVAQVVAFSEAARPLDEQQLREFGDTDLVVFTSASTATNLADAIGEVPLPDGVRLLSIGPKTSARVTERFGRVDVEAPDANLDGIVAALEGTS